jgi:hypothetical protein
MPRRQSIQLEVVNLIKLNRLFNFNRLKKFI